ncbi:hypothetical protein SLA2020_269980 [Shorea laevis]
MLWLMILTGPTHRANWMGCLIDGYGGRSEVEGILRTKMSIHYSWESNDFHGDDGKVLGKENANYKRIAVDGKLEWM